MRRATPARSTCQVLHDALGEHRMASFARVGAQAATAPAPVPWQERDWAERLEKAIERSEEHTSELQSQSNLVCRLLLEKKKKKKKQYTVTHNSHTTSARHT